MQLRPVIICRFVQKLSPSVVQQSRFSVLHFCQNVSLWSIAATLKPYVNYGVYSHGKSYTVDSAAINQIFCMESLFLRCNASHTVRLFVSLLLSISLPLCPLQLTLFHFLLSLLHILFFSFYNAFYNFSVTLSYSLHFPLLFPLPPSLFASHP